MDDNTCLTSDILKRPYARILVPGDDGRYSAELLEFPGCYACGDTPGEAIENLEKAAESWIDAALEQKQEIPEPLATYGYSGKINLRLPKSIHKQAARFAQKEDVSLNQFFTSAIAARIGAEDVCERLIKQVEERLSRTVCFVQIQQISTSQIPCGPIIRSNPRDFVSSFRPFNTQNTLTGSSAKMLPLQRVTTYG